MRLIPQNYKLEVRTNKKAYRTDKGVPIFLERYTIILNKEVHYLFFNSGTQLLGYFLADEDNPFTDHSQTDYETIFNNFAQVPIDKHETKSALKRVFDKVRDYHNNNLEEDKLADKYNTEKDSSLNFDLEALSLNSRIDFSIPLKKVEVKPKPIDEDSLEFILNEELYRNR